MNFFLGVHIGNTYCLNLAVVLRQQEGSGLFLNQKSLLTLYHSFLTVIFDTVQCITNWCYSNKTLVNKLQQLCNKSIRMTFGLKRNSNVNDNMSKFEI